MYYNSTFKIKIKDKKCFTKIPPPTTRITFHSTFSRFFFFFNPKQIFKISWLSFVILTSLFIACLNFPLFSHVFSIAENLQTFLLFFILYFCLLFASFALLFLPYLGKILLTLLIPATAFCVYFMHNFGVMIDTAMLENVLQTDAKEIQEILSLKFLFFVFIAVVLPLYCIYKIKIEFKNPKKQLMLQLATFLTSLTIAAIIFALSNAWLIPFLRTHQQIRFFNAPFYQGYSLVKLVKGRYFAHKDFRTLSTSASLKNPKDKKLLILVVGETARAQNYSLGGYLKNPTNLYTQSIPNLVFFPNFYACGTSTAISLPCMFSYSKRAHFKTNEFTENILDILQKAGVYITWLGNNSGGCKGVCDRLQERYLFTENYDGFLITKTKEMLKNQNPNRLLILHLQGSHGPSYFKRYPKEFERFLPTCKTNNLSQCSQDSIFNTYDNTLLYTDFLLQSLIHTLNNLTSYKVALLYLSDHGESLGENGIYLHGMPYFIAPKEQKHIPFIFWSNNARLNNLAKQRHSKEYSHDNLFSTLLGFFEVQMKENLYEPHLDIFANP